MFKTTPKKKKKIFAIYGNGNQSALKWSSTRVPILCLAKSYATHTHHTYDNDQN